MKKIFTIIAAALMSASMFAAPATVPTVTDLTEAGYDLTARVICLYFDEQVYYDIVWAGSYNGWSTTPAEMMTFKSLEGFEGWYVIELSDDSDPCQGKPVQLKKDGSFSWDFQSGDVEAWINMAQPGTKTATISVGNNQGEANCTWPSTGAYIYEVEYFKNHNTPYGAPEARKEFTFEAGEAAEADPAMFAITWGADGSSEIVKMTKKEDGIYVADILPTVDSVVLVRCAADATEIIWDGEGKNVWNQTVNYPLSDTMYFGEWVEETNLFSLTSEAPQPVETKYYAKNNWNNGDWAWKEMTKSGENVYTLERVVFGGTGVNINTKEEDTDAFWFDLETMTYVNGTIQAMDTVRFEFSQEDTVLTATLLGRPVPVARKEFTFEAGEAAEADPAMFAITWGADGSNETVKMSKKEDGIYVAEILSTVDSVVLVRCAAGATEIIWDGEGKNVWNQTVNYPLSDTMYFGEWVEETNLFSLTYEPFAQAGETELFVAANASVDHTWGQFENPECTWNATTGTFTVTIKQQAEWQWGNQVFLATGITTLDVTKEYQVSFDIVASTADCGAVTFKAFDDNQIAWANQNIAVTDVAQTWTSEWTKAPAATANGLMVWDFGWDPAQTVTITNISIKERDAQAPASGPTVDETGITINGRKYGFPVRLVKEVK